MTDFLEYIVKAIVKNPDGVKVEEDKTPDGINLILHVDESDMGLIIGKEGRTIKSIRNLVKSKAIKENIRVNVELYDPKYDQV